MIPTATIRGWLRASSITAPTALLLMMALPASTQGQGTGAPRQSPPRPGVRRPGSGPAPSQDATPTAKASAYRFDTSQLGKAPPPQLPQQLLGRDAFEQANIEQAFAGPMKGAAPQRIGGSRTSVVNDEWRIERDPLQGALLVARRAPGEVEPEKESGDPGKEGNAEAPRPVTHQNTIDGERARSLALERLQKFGIPQSELGEITDIQLISRDLEEGSTQPGPVALIDYKTFVFRAIHGVRVQGSRAVVTHWPDGTLKRTLAHWPAIARQGNRLSTRLSVEQITARATTVLSGQGVPAGRQASLRWTYVPTRQKNGEVTLRLVAIARVPAPEKAPEGSAVEPLEIEVPLDAQ